MRIIFVELLVQTVIITGARTFVGKICKARNPLRQDATAPFVTRAESEKFAAHASTGHEDGGLTHCDCFQNEILGQPNC
jgi:hypothetical protein